MKTNDQREHPSRPRVGIRSINDVSDALAASLEHGGLIVAATDLCADFFDLRTGFAGELFQKFTNYRARLAIVLADPRAHGERFGELAYEHRRHSLIRFFATEEDARQWLEQAGRARFKNAHAFQKDVLALPVADLDAASEWYCRHFRMTEVARIEQPVPTVILERDGVRIGFAINGGDSSQDGAAVLVSSIHDIRDELESSGVTIRNWRMDERGGQKYQVFFVGAPDGLCYYFHEAIE